MELINSLYATLGAIFLVKNQQRVGAFLNFLGSFFFLDKITSWLWIFIKTAPRDLSALKRFIKTKLCLRGLKQRNATVPRVFREVVNSHPNKTAILWEDQVWTFKQLDQYSNRIANFLESEGFKRGDELSLFMEGRPEYVAVWLGAAKAGVVTSLINTNLRQQSLIHSITAVNSKAVIFGKELTENVQQIIPDLKKKRDLDFYCLGIDEETVSEDATRIQPLSQKLKSASDYYPKSKMIGNFTDKLFYVYTSGTTGLPKAAIIKHCRYFYFGVGCNKLMEMTSDDVIYCAIPLYHLAGGAICTSQCLVFGNTLAIRTKFSASRFWTDCIKYKCTIAQYIGEICRYLLTQPPRETDKMHNVKVMFGNGLRSNIWKEFTERFNIETIAEFYGATEGNASVVNLTGTPGACGFVSQILPQSIVNMIYPVGVIRVNEETGEVIRDENGLCISCKPGESGEFVGKIVLEDPTRSFDGYVNKDATEKKIYRDVFQKGDAVFASGDLLTIDDLGFVYFKDRTGDTYRWKGENVSTTEVETILQQQVELSDVVVYGVPVPGCEGRAGMAAISDPERLVDLQKLLPKLQKCLPAYSIPVFIRCVDRIETTGTFKLPKVALQKEAYNPSIISDPLFYLDTTSGSYQKLDYSLYEDILNGQLRF